MRTPYLLANPGRGFRELACLPFRLKIQNYGARAVYDEFEMWAAGTCVGATHSTPYLSTKRPHGPYTCR